jgi:arylsulfatase A-like enzyme
MDRRLRSRTAVATALLALCTAACSGGGAPPNVLLISIDTLRPDRLGCYGHSRDTSPTLDALAAEGVLFTDVTSASPWTLPSHTSLLTGLYPSRHGVRGHTHKLKASVPTLAGILGEHGYQTMAVVNSHNLSQRYGLGSGFESFEYILEYEPDGSIPNRGPKVIRRAKKLLEGRDERPFFLFLHFYDAHTDFTPDEEYVARFVRPYEGEVDGSTKQLADLRANNLTLAEGDLRHLFDLYDAEIRQLDDLLGGFLRGLETKGVLENTFVVVTSDHGEEFMEHGSYLHGRTHYDEVIRIPLLVSGPGLPGGRRVDTRAHLVDVAPTILNLVGAELPTVNGIDLTPFCLNTGAPEPERLLFSEADHNNDKPNIRRMIRRANHKLIYDRMVDQYELFDLAADPGETRDLTSSDAELAEYLMTELRRFMSKSADGDEIGMPSEDVQKALRELGY